MPKKLQKSFQGYLAKIKNSPPHIQIPFNSIASSKNWILHGCKHAKTTSFTIEGRNDARGGGANNNNKDDGAATLSDIDRFLYENFRSLYVRDDEDTNIDKGVSDEKHEEAPKLGPILFDSARFMNPPSDLCGSNRFFFKPALSGSLLENPFTSMTSTGDEYASSSSTTTLNDSSSDSHHHLQAKQAMDRALPNNCIAVLTYSPSPYEDFRRSMRDVVEARSRNHESVDWDFMEELLFCYLNLNDKKSHKFVLSAFVDLVVVLRQHWGEHAAPGKPRSVRSVRLVKR